MWATVQQITKPLVKTDMARTSQQIYFLHNRYLTFNDWYNKMIYDHMKLPIAFSAMQ